MVVTDMRESFKRLPGDTSTYSLGDGEGAVRLARTAPVLAVDIETGSATSSGRWEVKAVAVADEQRAFVLDPRDPRGAAAIRDCLRAARRLVFHNAAYDVPALCAAGLMELESIGKVHDTLVTARLAWPGRGTSNSLGPLAERVLGGDYDRFKNALTDGFKSVSKGRVSKAEMFDRLGVASPAFVAYAAFDVIVTARVYAALPGHLSQALNPGLPGLRGVDAARLDQREQVVNRALLQASAVGLILDEDAVDSVIDALRAQADDSRKELVAAGVDPDGHPSVVKGSILAMLHASGRIPSSWPRLQNGALSTDKRWMSKLEGQPLVAAAVRMLEAQRFIKDYTGGTQARLAALEVFALGGNASGDDAAEAGYYAVRAALATTVSEAARHFAQKGLSGEGAPALARLITMVAARYKVQLSQKAAGMLVPGIGAAAGATINLMFMDHFQSVSRGHFTVRRLERRYGEAAVRAAWQTLGR